MAPRAKCRLGALSPPHLPRPVDPERASPTWLPERNAGWEPLARHIFRGPLASICGLLGTPGPMPVDGAPRRWPGSDQPSPAYVACLARRGRCPSTARRAAGREATSPRQHIGGAGGNGGAAGNGGGGAAGDVTLAINQGAGGAGGNGGAAGNGGGGAAGDVTLAINQGAGGAGHHCGVPPGGMPPIGTAGPCYCRRRPDIGLHIIVGCRRGGCRRSAPLAPVIAGGGQISGCTSLFGLQVLSTAIMLERSNDRKPELDLQQLGRTLVCKSFQLRSCSNVRTTVNPSWTCSSSAGLWSAALRPSVSRLTAQRAQQARPAGWRLLVSPGRRCGHRSAA